MSVEPGDASKGMSVDDGESSPKSTPSSSLGLGWCTTNRRRFILLSAGLLVIVALAVMLPLLLLREGEDLPANQPERPEDEPLDTEENQYTTELQPPITLSPSKSPIVPPRSSIILAILPDSQYTVEGSPYIFRSQIEWLASHHDALGEPFVIHVGDIVQNPRNDDQWESAARAMLTLAKENIEHSVSSGNHDIVRHYLEDDERDTSDESYLVHFGSGSLTNRSVDGRDGTGWSEYHIANIQGVELLVLATDWRASESTMAWAHEVLEEHSNTPAILVSHEFLMPAVVDDEEVSTITTLDVDRTEYGELLWKELVETSNQIFMVICGHIDGSGYRMDANASGQQVLQLLINYQEQFGGGLGYTRLMELDFVRSTIEQFTFSPWVQKLWEEEGLGAMSPHDLAILGTPNSNFTVHMNLTKRFHNIGATVPEELAKVRGISWLKSVRSKLGEVPLPDESWYVLPNDTNDYVELPDTVAHWRFDGMASEDDLAVAPGHNVPADVLVLDHSGNGNHLLRRNTTGGLPEHLFLSDEHHPLSSSPASLCFANADRTEGAYLATVDSAPLNDHTFAESGYTIEAFVKLPSSFLDDSRPFRWTGIVTRTGLIMDVYNEDEVEGDTNEPLAVLGVSNLAEIQFASWPMKHEKFSELGYMRSKVTAWSSPLQLEKWYHVAVTNDGNQTRMYINGWPARRDPVYDAGVAGIPGSSGQGWLIGASFYAERTKVFGGCIGEVRITAKALQRDEFLLSRR